MNRIEYILLTTEVTQKLQFISEPWVTKYLRKTKTRIIKVNDFNVQLTGLGRLIRLISLIRLIGLITD